MEATKKFQDLLRELFQFETSDLDFGIYRILNFKKDKIEEYINETLVKKVKEAFSIYKKDKLENINRKLEEAKEKIISNLGHEALSDVGELRKEFNETTLAKIYQSLRKEKEESESIVEIENSVFNDLYTFFSRYYEDGDFIPQYRYSIKDHKYAIPYNGEEVKLYWANNEQYYTKTGNLFRDYRFKANDNEIIFRILSAREEVGSKKATKERFFILDDEEPIKANDDKTIMFQFQYRELTVEEIEKFQIKGGSNTSKQNKLIDVIYEEALSGIENINLKAILSKEYRNGKSLLLYHLSRFTQKNMRDYFIHKNLKKFLTEQLDYYIKAEVLSIENLSESSVFDKHVAKAKVVRQLGEDIINFLAQIEDFQKRLWEKKKFVLKTEYVITADRIPKQFYDTILENEEQQKEWEELGFDVPDSADMLSDKKLPIDTHYFDQKFKNELLEKLTEKENLDDMLDGLLIKSENWQALNLLLEKYKEKLQAIYIDPPFNKEQDADYLYNVKYKNSTWATMLENRLIISKYLLSDKGSMFVRCDYNGNWIVRCVMDEVFNNNFKNEIILNRSGIQKEARNKFLTATDSLFLFAKKEAWSPNELFESRETDWLAFVHYPGERGENKERLVFGYKLPPPQNRHWGIPQELIDRWCRKHWIRFRCKVCGYEHYEGQWTKCEKCEENQFIPEIKNPPKKIDSNWSTIPSYSQDPDFPTRNAEQLLHRVIETSSYENDLVMDFFLGSGTTSAVAHKIKRKWIGIEMGEHFLPYKGKDNTVTGVLVRMKRVLAYDKSGISKGLNEYKGGGFFKYQILEQYEDAIDNIELKENLRAADLFEDEYFLKYFLEFESKDNAGLLNAEQLKTPFSYKLKVNPEEIGEPQEIVVDIPETFNYLLGLKIKKIKTRNNKQKYMFLLGEKEGKDIAVVWRDYHDAWDEKTFGNDRDFISRELGSWSPHIVYINGQSVLTPDLGRNTVEIRYIEPEFKTLMG